MNNAYLLEGLEALPIIARILLERTDPIRLDTPTGPDRFTPREVIAHLADWEPRLRGRIVTALKDPGAAVPTWDEGELAIENGYATCDWREQVDTFTKQRQETIALLKRLGPEDWRRTFTHPERGPMTVEDQAAFLLGHDLYHAEQFAQAAG